MCKIKFNQPAKLSLPEDFISHIKLSPKIYDGDCTQYFNQDEAVMYPVLTWIKETAPSNKKKYIFRFEKAKDCIFLAGVKGSEVRSFKDIHL